MKKFWLLSLVFLVGVTAFSLIPASPVSGRPDKFKKSRNAIANKYIVVLDEDALDAEKTTPEKKARGLAARYRGNVDKIFDSALKGFSVSMNEKQAKSLSDDPSVSFVEEDAEFFVSNIQSNVTWGIDRTDQRDLPLDGVFDFNASGQGVHAYIIDTGIRTSHVEFGGRAVMSYSAIKDGYRDGDCHGHGTHVAGTLGGSTFGVAKNVMLHGVRVMNCQGQGSTSDIVAGIDWVTKRHVKPAVANMSLGGGGSMTMDAAVRKSIAAGVTYVIAAGNGNQNACFVSPARVLESITVGATDNFDKRTYFSNYGECVDIFAPGLGITSAGNSDDYAIRAMSGTSMSSPHVAGVAALFLEANPTASPAEVDTALSQSATAGIVTDPMGTPNLLLYSSLGDEPEVCTGRVFGGIMTAPGQVDYHSSIYGFRGLSGTYTGTLKTPSGARFQLELEAAVKGGSTRWQTVLSTTDTRRTSTTQNASTFRWKVTSLSGSGEYTLCSETP